MYRHKLNHDVTSDVLDAYVVGTWWMQQFCSLRVKRSEGKGPQWSFSLGLADTADLYRRKMQIDELRESICKAIKALKKKKSLLIIPAGYIMFKAPEICTVCFKD